MNIWEMLSGQKLYVDSFTVFVLFYINLRGISKRINLTRMIIDTPYDQKGCPQTWRSYYRELNQGALEYKFDASQYTMEKPKYL